MQKIALHQFSFINTLKQQTENQHLKTANTLNTPLCLLVSYHINYCHMSLVKTAHRITARR